MITTLTDEQIGSTVFYVPGHAKNDPQSWEMGRIKSFDNERKVAWVVYSNGNQDKIDRFEQYTGASTSYTDLSFTRGIL